MLIDRLNNSVFRAPDDGSGDSGGAAAGDGQPSSDGGGDGQQQTTQQQGGGQGMLTQSQVDDIAAARAQREREKFQNQLADLGFEGGFDDLQEFVEKQQEKKRKQKEEQEKFRELYQQEKEERERLLEEKNQEIERLQSTWQQEKVQRALSQAATDAVNPSQVTALLQNRIQLDDNNNPYPVDENGQRITDGNGEYLTVEQYVDQWLDDNPHFRRAAGGKGGNSRPGAGGAAAPDTGDFDLERALNDQEYAVEHREKLGQLVKGMSG